jgi:hypothetical protein
LYEKTEYVILADFPGRPAQASSAGRLFARQLSGDMSSFRYTAATGRVMRDGESEIESREQVFVAVIAALLSRLLQLDDPQHAIDCLSEALSWTPAPCPPILTQNPRAGRSAVVR